MKKFLIGWLAITATCWLVIGGLLAPVVPGGGRTIALAALLLSAPMTVLLRGFTRQTYPRRSIRLFVVRPFWYVQLLLPFALLAAVLGMVAGALVGAFNAAPWGWAVVGGRGAVMMLAAVASAFFMAGYVGSRRLLVRRFIATVPNLPAGFDGMRIVQLSDLHVGPHTPAGKLARIAAVTRDAQPDLIRCSTYTPERTTGGCRSGSGRRRKLP